MTRTVWIIGGSAMQMPAIQAARELGYEVLLTDANPDCPGVKAVNEFYKASTQDAKAHGALALTLKEIGRDDIKGVFTTGSDAEVSVSTVAEVLGLRAISVDAARNCKNKILTREHLRGAGLAQPSWYAGKRLADLAEAADRIGYPVIIKTPELSGSRGISVHDNPSLFFTAAIAARELSPDGRILIEKYVRRSEGNREYSTELLFDNRGICHRLNTVERRFKQVNNVPVEVGHINPAPLPKWQSDGFFELAERAAAQLGINHGAFKLDTIKVGSTVYILEVTARLSGGYDASHTTPLASGRDFIGAALRVSLGMDVGECLIPGQSQFAACYAPLIGDESNCAERKEFRIAVANDAKEAWRKAKDGVELVHCIGRK